MPCNLGLSVANARVADEAIARLLTPQVAERIARAYAKEKGLALACYPQPDGLYATLGGVSLAIVGGAVQATPATYRDTARAREVAAELTAALTAAGEALFAAQVQRALGRLAPGKVVAARAVEVEEDGARARATILTLNL